MGRISRESMFMSMARVASQRSTCSRLNVGAIVTLHNSPVSIGWNGAEAGAQHCPGNTCVGMTPGRCPAIHAEDNALRKACEVLSDKDDPVDLYVTHSPCEGCTNRIIYGQICVKRVFFEIPYRSVDHLAKLRQLNGPPGSRRRTEVYEVTPAGYIVEYFSRQVVELP